MTTMQRPSLSVMLDRASGGIHIEYRPTGAAAGLLIDRQSEEVQPLVRSLFAICQGAQVLASRRALRAAEGTVRSTADDQAKLETVRYEALRETALHILVAWPMRLGEPRADWAAGEVMRLTRDGDPSDRLSNVLGEAVFGCSPAAWLDRSRSDPAAVLAWADAGMTCAARFIAYARSDDAVPAAPRAIPDGPLARNVLEPALDSFAPLSLAGHHMARLVELARLAVGGIDVPEAFSHSEAHASSSGMGEGRVACSRGVLVHRAWLKQGRVSHYEIVSPTDRALALNGPGRDWLKAAAAVSNGARARVIADVLLALDPCVEYGITWLADGTGGES